jgi:hypothetical protein
MAKRLILPGLCIMGLLLPSWAQQGPAVIEFLTLASTGSSILWELRPDPTVQSNFESPILLSIDVPPSPKSQAVYLEFWGQYIVTWSSNPIRVCVSLIYYKLTSPAIPNIEFSQAYSIPPTISETNYAGDHSYPTYAQTRYKGYSKMPLRRDLLQWWNVWDKSTGQFVPRDEALIYAGQLIDNGFKAEVWAGGTIQGLSYIAPFSFQVEVTRLSTKK